MLKNYLKVAWRNLVRNKTYSFINITGLAIGLSCFLLIVLYVMDELSYDRYNTKADRIYRINSDIRFGGTDLNMPTTSDTSNGSKLIKKGDQFINEQNVAHGDSTLFSVFTLPSIQGDTKTALNEPNTVVITESTAKKYFNTTNAIGKTIETNDNNSTIYKVTAVIKDIPRNSHFTFDFIFSMDNVDYGWGNYLSHNFHTYLLLKEGTDPKVFESNFKQYIDNYVAQQAKQMMNISDMSEFEKAGNKLVYTLMPLTKLHLYSNRQFEISPGGNAQYVYIFSAVALFILVIACINFMNLTTARSANRAREVGIRKVLGTEKRELVTQFLSESTLLAAISLILAIGIAALVLPLFNNVAAKSLTLRSFITPIVLPLIIALPFVVGLLAGSYPAFYLSAFKPILVLKGKLNLGSKGGGFRNILVVFQFTASILLIIGTIVIYKQLNYIQTKNLGFKKDQVFIVNEAYALKNNSDAFKNEMLKIPGVVSGTFSGYLPVPSSRSDNTFSKVPSFDSKNGFNMQNWRIDYDYFKTLGMEIVKGRNFSKDFGADSNGIIINESTAKLIGYDDPIGQKLYTIRDNSDNSFITYDIIGVVRNFHFESLRQNISPVSFILGRSRGFASFKINTSNIHEIVKQAENKWKTLAPGMPFSHQFLDESFDEMYRNEQRVGKIALIFAVLAVFIACLGLFGLSTFIAEQRTKEIGIRKVLGASVQGIVRLLSKNFLILVLVSFIIAAPLAWYFMNSWLQDFAFRVDIGWWVFALAALIAVVIALTTVSFQAIRAALSNPVKSLRSE